ncbi:hypothetical protein CupriaWKF_33815 [Cupriavidus sp. WKF15]|nr:hypothetical protein [Cupriavidus sp. WKF15]WER51015.1 hypothetical protein CupriaWKF_33815 [Cupriavidus sp. WKF15]
MGKLNAGREIDGHWPVAVASEAEALLCGAMTKLGWSARSYF